MTEKHYDRNGWKRVCVVLTVFNDLLKIEEEKKEIILHVVTIQNWTQSTVDRNIHWTRISF